MTDDCNCTKGGRRCAALVGDYGDVRFQPMCDGFLPDIQERIGGMSKQASWESVRDKGRAIYANGGVEIHEETPSQITAYVMSGVVEGEYPVTDGGPYEVILSKRSWENSGNVGGWVQGFLCDCKWGFYHSGHPGAGWQGRFCSHAYATLLAANARARSDFFGDRTASRDPFVWFHVKGDEMKREVVGYDIGEYLRRENDPYGWHGIGSETRDYPDGGYAEIDKVNNDNDRWDFEWFSYDSDGYLLGCGIEGSPSSAEKKCDSYHDVSIVGKSNVHKIVADHVPFVSLDSMKGWDFTPTDSYWKTLKDESGDVVDLFVWEGPKGWSWNLADYYGTPFAFSDAEDFSTAQDALDDFNDWVSFNVNGGKTASPSSERVTSKDWVDFVSQVELATGLSADPVSAYAPCKWITLHGPDGAEYDAEVETYFDGTYELMLYNVNRCGKVAEIEMPEIYYEDGAIVLDDRGVMLDDLYIDQYDEETAEEWAVGTLKAYDLDFDEDEVEGIVRDIYDTYRPDWRSASKTAWSNQAEQFMSGENMVTIDVDNDGKWFYSVDAPDRDADESSKAWGFPVEPMYIVTLDEGFGYDSKEEAEEAFRSHSKYAEKTARDKSEEIFRWLYCAYDAPDWMYDNASIGTGSFSVWLPEYGDVHFEFPANAHLETQCMAIADELARYGITPSDGYKEFEPYNRWRRASGDSYKVDIYGTDAYLVAEWNDVTLYRADGSSVKFEDAYADSEYKLTGNVMGELWWGGSDEEFDKLQENVWNAVNDCFEWEREAYLGWEDEAFSASRNDDDALMKCASGWESCPELVTPELRHDVLDPEEILDMYGAYTDESYRKVENGMLGVVSHHVGMVDDWWSWDTYAGFYSYGIDCGTCQSKDEAIAMCERSFADPGFTVYSAKTAGQHGYLVKFFVKRDDIDDISVSGFDKYIVADSESEMESKVLDYMSERAYRDGVEFDGFDVVREIPDIQMAIDESHRWFTPAIDVIASRFPNSNFERISLTASEESGWKYFEDGYCFRPLWTYYIGKAGRYSGVHLMVVQWSENDYEWSVECSTRTLDSGRSDSLESAKQWAVSNYEYRFPRGPKIASVKKGGIDKTATRKFTYAEMKELEDEIEGRELHNSDRFKDGGLSYHGGF